MKRSELRKIIKEELLREAKDFYRLPKKSIGNDLYSIQKELPDIYESLDNGGDFNMERWDSIIKRMQKIKTSAKKFKAGSHMTEIPKEYR